VALARPLLLYQGHTRGPQVDINDLLDQAKPAERTIPLCLRGDLVAEFEDLERKLAEVEKKPTDSLASGGEARAVAEQMQALREQMESSTAAFRLRALPRKPTADRPVTFRMLADAHPPRQKEDGNPHPEDELGVNTSTIFEPLIRACLVEPSLDDKQWARLEAVLSDLQYERLGMVAWGVNRGDVDIPFSSAASRLLRTSADE
jgi:hypothetical protein